MDETDMHRSLAGKADYLEKIVEATPDNCSHILAGPFAIEIVAVAEVRIHFAVKALRAHIPGAVEEVDTKSSQAGKADDLGKIAVAGPDNYPGVMTDLPAICVAPIEEAKVHGKSAGSCILDRVTAPSIRTFAARGSKMSSPTGDECVPIPAAGVVECTTIYLPGRGGPVENNAHEAGYGKASGICAVGQLQLERQSRSHGSLYSSLTSL